MASVAPVQPGTRARLAGVLARAPRLVFGNRRPVVDLEETLVATGQALPIRVARKLFQAMVGPDAGLATIPVSALRLLCGDVGIVSTRYQRDFAVDLRDDGCSFLIWSTGSFDQTQLDWVSTVVAPGATVVDVGANIGWYSAAFRRFVGPRGRVIAVEPDPATAAFSALNRSLDVAFAGSFELIVAAAAEAPGTLKLRSIPIGTRGHQYLVDDTDDGPTIDVAAVRLDDVLRDEQQIDFVKIDIEGRELRALRGMEETLDRFPAAVVMAEFAPTFIREAGLDPAEQLRFFTERGYAVYAFASAGVRLLTDAEIGDLPTRLGAHHYNYVFSRRPL